MVSPVTPRASSVGRRLTLITVLASALALTLALGSVAVSEGVAFRRALRADIGTLADLVSANTAAAVLFDDQNNARETLESLRYRRNVSAAALSKLSNRGWVNENEEYSVAERFRRSMGIRTPAVSTQVGTLSGGNQQKVVLAKWMFTDPDVLILDEPTRGIDVGAKYEIYSIINDLAAQGKAVLVISSELPELLGLCDRVYALSEGRITGELDRAEATQERLMQYMTRGQNS